MSYPREERGGRLVEQPPWQRLPPLLSLQNKFQSHDATAIGVSIAERIVATTYKTGQSRSCGKSRLVDRRGAPAEGARSNLSIRHCCSFSISYSSSIWAVLSLFVLRKRLRENRKSYSRVTIRLRQAIL
eukprot:scaffold197798_cov78-Attheya_sp.AAC.2